MVRDPAKRILLMHLPWHLVVVGSLMAGLWLTYSGDKQAKQSAAVSVRAAQEKESNKAAFDEAHAKCIKLYDAAGNPPADQRALSQCFSDAFALIKDN